MSVWSLLDISNWFSNLLQRDVLGVFDPSSGDVRQLVRCQVVCQRLEVHHLVFRLPLLGFPPFEIGNDVVHDPKCDLQSILFLSFLGFFIALFLLLRYDRLDVALVNLVVRNVMVVDGFLLEQVILLLQQLFELVEVGP